MWVMWAENRLHSRSHSSTPAPRARHGHLNARRRVSTGRLIHHDSSGRGGRSCRAALRGSSECASHRGSVVTTQGGNAERITCNGPTRTRRDVVAARPVLHFWHSVQQCMQYLSELWAFQALRFWERLPCVPTVPLFQRRQLISRRHPSSIRRTIGTAPVDDLCGPAMLPVGKSRWLLCCGWLHCHPERMGSHLRIRRGVYGQLQKLPAFVPKQWLHVGRLGSYVCRVAVPAAARFPAANLSATANLSDIQPTRAPGRSTPFTGDKSDHANVLPAWFDVRGNCRWSPQMSGAICHLDRQRNEGQARHVCMR